MTQSAVSRHIANLERLLGRKLADRRATGIDLTADGATLLATVTGAFDELQRALNDIQCGPSVRVHMPQSFLQWIGMRLLQDFHREHPSIAIEVSSSNVTGMPEAEVDVAVVFDRPKVGNAIHDLLWIIRLSPACSPETWRKSEAATLAELLQRNELLHVRVEDRPVDYLWTEFAARAGIALTIRQGLTFETASLAAQYAAGGSGIALLDRGMIRQEIADRGLIVPFDIAVELGDGFYLALDPSALDKPATRLFRRWIIDWFEAGNVSVTSALPARPDREGFQGRFADGGG